MDAFSAIVLAIAGLFIGMLLMCEAGRRIGVRSIRRYPDGLAKGTGAAEAAVFGLLGLLIAFTFSGAASRFEARRHLIVEEANMISTAFLRLDLLPKDAQPELKRLFREYVQLRFSVYRNGSDTQLTESRLAQTAVLQNRIWQKAIVICNQPTTPSSVTMLVLPALNDMIDITSTRAGATQNHPPLIIFLLLGGLSLIGALLVGYGAADSANRNWLHPLIFSAILPLTVYVIVDLEFPRWGFVQVDSADKMLLALPEH
ncbi:hypothetical protein FB548_2045 [Pseudoxanthomonas sp. 3HH-4]|uniref:bestrophin-like domain n=1 Tax=Pseudoxanthomonas sp. 3HH-4 TaxID=1690214 RepID=UPI00114FFB99|nr:DUF4239 domain-containing protein [Pseudoxanthomonas sp. 3HH-4]TQM12120.1 hypothetical protein FB548_2045 [Pseudoxanthomonas sp. 3HH-4]